MTSLTEEVKAIGWYEQRISGRAGSRNYGKRPKVRIQTFRNGSGISASSKKECRETLKASQSNECRLLRIIEIYFPPYRLAAAIARSCVSRRCPQQRPNLVAPRGEPYPRGGKPVQGHQLWLDHFEEAFDKKQAHYVSRNQDSGTGKPMSVACDQQCYNF